MLLDYFTIFIFAMMTLILTIIAYFLPKTIGNIVEIVVSASVLLYLFIVFPFTEAMLYMSTSAATYASFGTLFNRDNRKARLQVKEKIERTKYQKIDQERDLKRIWIDLLLTLFVSGGALAFLVFAPDSFFLFNFIISFALISILEQSVERFGNFFSTSLYWLPETERFIIISLFQSRDYPLADLKEVTRESAPDLLKLHPLFTFLTENKNYTESFQAVLKLSFPGEHVYFSPVDIARWEEVFNEYIIADKDEIALVLPIWHPKVLKRLFWKGYFAVTVKGVSAYTGLILILAWLDVSVYIMIGSVVVWLLFNLYVSDRVLIAGTDAIELEEGEVFRRAQQIFKKAKIPKTKLYLIDSPIHNGLATGMNIGRGTVMLTKATMELPVEAVEAILAHEAIHVKNRDVLMNQIARILFLGLMGGAIYLFYDQLVLLADRPVMLALLAYLLTMLFPIYLSLIAQWAEIRADHFGAKLLCGGGTQMESGLRALGDAQDQSLDKTFEYRMSETKPMNSKASIERDNWFFRLIEFQFQAHPPLYFRIQCLSENLSWWKTKKKWFVDRIVESFPDFMRKRNRE